MCSVKVCTTWLLIVTHVSTTDLYQWLAAVPLKEFRSAVYVFYVDVGDKGDTGEPKAQP